MISRMISPWSRYHLFRNPFGELTRAERAELAVVDVSAYLIWLGSPDRRPSRAAIQFMGRCGHGKTTHLLALQRALLLRYQAAHDAAQGNPVCDHSIPDAPLSVGYVYFPEEGTQPVLPKERPLLVDEAQRMRWLRRRQLLRGPGPLIIGTHVDLAPQLQRHGFDVLSVSLDAPLPASHLQQMLNRRILASRLKIAGSEQPLDQDFHPLCLTLTQVVALQERFGSNIRAIEQHLFDALQRFVDKGEPWLPAS